MYRNINLTQNQLFVYSLTVLRIHYQNKIGREARHGKDILCVEGSFDEKSLYHIISTNSLRKLMGVAPHLFGRPSKTFLLENECGFYANGWVYHFPIGINPVVG